MIALIDFAVPAVLISAVALFGFRLLEHAPAWTRLALVSFGLAAWFVPWPLLGVVAGGTDALDAVTLIGDGREQWLAIKTDLAGALEAIAPAPGVRSYLWLSVFIPGVVWLALDLRRYRGSLVRWTQASRDAPELKMYLPARLRRSDPAIRVVTDSSVAVAVGLIRPVIFVGDHIAADRDALRVAITHESCHLKRLDPIWMILITAAARLYWFNPIVYALKRRAALAIESACDEACVSLIGRDSYRQTLARLLLRFQTHPVAPAVAPGLVSPSANLARLQFLGQTPRLGNRVLAVFAAMPLALVAGLALAGSIQWDLRIGEWIEVGDASRYGYDVMPAWRRVERLSNGMLRFYEADAWTDVRCDGRDYPINDTAGATSSSVSCTTENALTTRIVTRGADGSDVVAYATETVSSDGQTLERAVEEHRGGHITATRTVYSRLN